MLRDKWFLAGLVIIIVAGGTAFIVGSAIRTSWEQTRGSAVPPTQPVVTPAPAGTLTPRTGAPAVPPRSPSGAQATVAIVRRHPAWRKIEAGRFREAQEDFLELLLINPSDQEAMSGLVLARRRLAGDDPNVLMNACVNDAARLGVSRQTVYNWATRFKERRGQCDVPTRLADDKRSGRGKTTAYLIDPLIEAVLPRDPHEFGYCAPRWTPTILERYLRTVAHITVCRRSVSLALQRLGGG
jgi:transposase